jgi:peptide/nickel transport system substrate-binding protein/oligopeptide transport system substrate-binding protein
MLFQLFRRRKSVYRKLSLFMLIILSLLLVAVPGSAQDDNVDVYGRTLPEDAAPYELQTWRELCNAERTEISLSSVVSVYQRICDLIALDQYSDSLVQLDQNMQLFAGAAESWEPTEDGLAWIFHLRGDQMWNDGTPVTANDWVRSFQFMADPENAYDFVWMWLGVIEGWDEAVAGEITPAEVGVEAVDDNTLMIRTQNPFPPLPATMAYWPPMQAAALGEPGAWNEEYMLDPETAVSSGPFVLKEFVPGDRLVLEANPDYVGPRTPWLRQIVGTYGDQLNGSFIAFQNHEIDRVNYGHLSPADYEIINQNDELRENFRPHAGDFRADYILFDTFNPPFDDVNVRLAFAKAVDRQAIADNVINVGGAQAAYPATTFLAPGFPGWDEAGDFSDYQAYDCEAAQGLLADAGYPDGEGFPAQELKLRGESEGIANWYLAAVTSIGECLNIEMTINNMEFNAYMEALLARPTTLQLGGVSYGMDYLDPANMLGVWKSTGRQSWRSAEYDNLVNEADQVVGDPEGRMAMYHEAERILVEDVGGVFLFHRNLGDLFQPYVAGGGCFTPDNQGIAAFHWNNQWCWGEFYITNAVLDYDTWRGSE